MTIRLLQFILLVVCAIAIGWHLRTLLLARASLEWPVVSGRVLAAFLDEVDSDRQGDRFYPRVRYRYSVRGREYEGTRLWFRTLPSADYSASLALIRDIRAGQEVEIRFDPGRPERAVLIPGYDAYGVADVGAVALFLVLAFFWLPNFFRV